MFLIFTDGFIKDLVVLILITILIGSALCGALAAAADAYFGDTVNGLIGDVGEYDLILHIRKDMKDTVAAELQKYLDARFNGGTFKEGPTVAGKSNFFITLPENAKNRNAMENLGTYFQDIPGNSGYTVMLEPRITLRGTEGNISEFLINEIEQIPGVRFAFRRGSSVDVVLDSMDYSGSVKKRIKELLLRYKVVEVKFPLDEEIENSAAKAYDIKTEFKESLDIDVVLNINDASGDDELQSFVDTLSEMKRFLSHYSSRVYIQHLPGYDLGIGDRLILKGEDADDVIIEVTRTLAGESEGIIVRGDASNLPNYGTEDMVEANKLEANGGPGELVGMARVESPRHNLSYSIEESIKLLKELDAMTDEINGTVSRVVYVMEKYDETLAHLEEISALLKATNDQVVSSISGLDHLGSWEIKAHLENASKSIDATLNSIKEADRVKEEPETGNSSIYVMEEKLDELLRSNAGNASTPYYQRLLLLKKGLEVFKASKDGRISALGAILNTLDPVANSLMELKLSIEGLTANIDEMGSLTESGLKAKAALDNLASITDMTLLQLKAFDIWSVRENIRSISDDLQALRDSDVEAIIEQMEHIQKAMPQLRDEEITSSIKLLERYIDGQVISRDRLLFLIDGPVTKADAEKVVKRGMSGNERTNVSILAPAMIEPDVRSSVHHILREVRSSIAALLGIAFTIFILMVDHCQLMAVMKRLRARSRHNKWKVWRFMPDESFIYGGAVGAFILISIFFITGAKVPLLNNVHVILIGAILGTIASLLAERFSPANEEELMAGEALGLSYLDILREIVIPSGRPGLLYYLNSKRFIFKDKPFPVGG